MNLFKKVLVLLMSISLVVIFVLTITMVFLNKEYSDKQTAAIYQGTSYSGSSYSALSPTIKTATSTSTSTSTSTPSTIRPAGLNSLQPSVQNAPPPITLCYIYSPNSIFYPNGNYQTTTIDLGGGKSLTIPNQNPPSILQNMLFPAVDLYCPLYFNTYSNDRITASFITSNGLINSSGPWPFIPLTNEQGGNGPLVYMSYISLSDIGGTGATKISNEDAIINEIASTNKFAMRVGNTNYPMTSDMSVPATNCAKIAGNGPRKVVFMRGNSWNSEVGVFLNQVNSIIESGFKQIDPLKKYVNQFSFYVDLKKHDEAIFPKDVDDRSRFDRANTGPSIISAQSSCSPVIGRADQYFFYYKDSVNYDVGAYATIDNIYAIAFFNVAAALGDLDYEKSFLISGIHELGHSFAGLGDEYVYGDRHFMDLAYKFPLPSKNCAVDPYVYYRSFVDDKIYGSVSTNGCSFFSPISHIPTVKYYRPSLDSIMNSKESLKFNVVSCGYIIAAIKGENHTKANAEKYWPECMTLDVIKDGIPPVMPKPAVNSVSKAVAPNSFNVSGLGFTPTGNSVKLTFSTPISLNLSGFKFSLNNIFNIADAQTPTSYYEINDISSPDGTTLSFTVATTTPSGIYKVSASALNSPWNDTLYEIIVSGGNAEMKDVTTRCEMTIYTCSLHSEYNNKTLNDTYDNSANNQSRCLLRANDWVTWCGGTNAKATAKYYIGPTLIDWKTVSSPIVTYCELSISSCVLHPEYNNQTLQDTYENSNTIKQRCAQRARDWVSWCGINTTATAKFYQGTSTKAWETASSPVTGPVSVTTYTGNPAPISIDKGAGPASVYSGSSIYYTLNWLYGPTVENQSIFVHFVDSAGVTKFSASLDPTPGTSNWSGWAYSRMTIKVPPDVPAGTYKIMAGLYKGNVRLPLRPGTGVVADNQMRYQVGTIIVKRPLSLVSCSHVATGLDINVVDRARGGYTAYGNWIAVVDGGNGTNVFSWRVGNEIDGIINKALKNTGQFLVSGTNYSSTAVLNPPPRTGYLRLAYNTVGQKTASVTVTSDGQTVTGNCMPAVVVP